MFEWQGFEGGFVEDEFAENSSHIDGSLLEVEIDEKVDYNFVSPDFVAGVSDNLIQFEIHDEDAVDHNFHEVDADGVVDCVDDKAVDCNFV